MGRNPNLTWLLLDLPDLEQHCWVWIDLLDWSGDLSSVPVIDPEDLDESGLPLCSGLSEQDCKARSDCQWVDVVVQPAYCTDK